MTTEQHILNSLGITLTKIYALLDERLPAAPIDDATNARYEREDAEARQEFADALKRLSAVERAPREDEADLYFERMEKAEAERDGWTAKHAALRADVERMSRDDGPVISNKVAADGAMYILDRDDARDPQADPDTVTLPRDDAEALLRFWEIAGGNGVVRDIPRRTRAALGWGDSDEA